MVLTACPYTHEKFGGVYSPHAVYDKDTNRYLILYQRESAYDYPDTHIYGRLLNADGTPAAAEFDFGGVFSYDYSSYLATAYDERNHRVLVVWSTSDRISGQMVNMDGTLVGTVSVISEDCSRPVAAYDSVNAQFLIVWADRSNNSAFGIYARLINADGTLQGPRVLISDSFYLRYYDDGPVSASYDADTQRFLVVMKDSRDVYAQAVNSDGTLSGNAVHISDTADFPDQPVALYDGMNKRFIVNWLDHNHLRGQFVNSDGTLQGGSFVMSDAFRSSGYHAIAFNAADQQYFEVFEVDDDRDYLYSQVYGQIVNADGTFPNTASNGSFMISPQDFPGEYRFPCVVFNSTNRNYLVLWQYLSHDSRYSDIHGQMINPDGTLEGSVFVAAAGGQ